jgi:hypothetical protein
MWLEMLKYYGLCEWISRVEFSLLAIVTPELLLHQLLFGRQQLRAFPGKSAHNTRDLSGFSVEKLQ